VAATAQVVGLPEHVDRFAGSLGSFRVAAGSQLVMQYPESVQIPTFGACVAQASGCLDSTME
jgi:hypothetical protein